MRGGIVPTASPYRMAASRSGCLNAARGTARLISALRNGYDAACALAEAKQAEWLRFRERRAFCSTKVRSGDRQASGQTKQQQQLAAFPSAEAATAYLRATSPNCNRDNGLSAGGVFCNTID